MSDLLSFDTGGGALSADLAFSGLGIPFAGQLLSKLGLFGSKKAAPIPPTFSQIVQGKAKPIATTGLANVAAQQLILPEQIKLAQQFNPQLAATYGDSYNALLKAILPQYESLIAPAINRIQAAGAGSQRESDIADVTRLAAPSRSAFEALDPNSARLVELIQQSALGQFSNDPSQLTPMNQRRVEQNVRSAQAARGGGFGTNATWQEAMQTYLAGDAQRRAAQQEGAGAIGLGRQFYGDPFASILGRPSNTANTALGYGQQASQQYGQSGAQSFDAFGNQGINDLWSGLFSQDQNTKNIAAADRAGQRQLIGAGIGALGSIAGGALGGMI